MERSRIVFSGAGGQGIITAAIVLAEAAVLYENLNATQAQSYGPEARGGASRADVIISDTDIRYPKVIQPNVLVCLTQEAYTKFHAIIRPGGLLLVDSRFVETYNKVHARQIQLPMYQTIMEQIGKPIVFNICMLGVVIELIGLVRSESIIKTLTHRLPKEVLPINKQALHLGMELGRHAHR